jgi:hypothetical protein
VMAILLLSTATKRLLDLCFMQALDVCLFLLCKLADLCLDERS